MKEIRGQGGKVNKQDARELEARINREAPGLQTEVRRCGSPGKDESWYVRIAVVQVGVVSSMEMEDERQWEQFKAVKKQR